MSTHCGVLIFYRWPEDTPWEYIPASLSQMTVPCSYESIAFIIPLGLNRAREDGNSPEHGTACMAYNVFAESVEARQLVLSTFNAYMGEAVHPCRSNDQGTPRSAVMWLAGQERVDSLAHRTLELNDLIVRKLKRIIESLKIIVQMMKANLLSDTAKRRRKAEEQNLIRALEATSNTPSSSSVPLKKCCP